MWMVRRCSRTFLPNLDTVPFALYNGPMVEEISRIEEPCYPVKVERWVEVERRRIERLCQRLPDDHPARQLALGVLEHKMVPASEVRRLIAFLKDPTESPLFTAWGFGSFRMPSGHAERELVCWILGQLRLPPDIQRQVATVLADTVVNQRLVDRKMRQAALGRGIRGGIFWAVPLYVYILCVFSSSNYHRLLEYAGLLAILGVICLALGVAAALPLTLSMETGALNQLRSMALTALGRQPVAENVNVLAGFLLNDTIQLHQAAVEGLSEVLPLLTSEHYGRLASDTVPILANYAQYALDYEQSGNVFRPDHAMRLALLLALEKVGDARAIASVRTLAEHPRSVDLQETARHVLSVLEERQRQETDRATLLRGSQSNSAAPEVLLRPVSGQPETTPIEQLLRPRYGPAGDENE